jgi:hypothetical protein
MRLYGHPKQVAPINGREGSMISLKKVLECTIHGYIVREQNTAFAQSRPYGLKFKSHVPVSVKAVMQKDVQR